jgi:hypothetical protein
MNGILIPKEVLYVQKTVFELRKERFKGIAYKK